MGAEKGNEWIKVLLDDYNDRHLIDENGNIDFTSNVITISKITKEKYNVVYDGNFINVPNVFCIYPKDYFCPKYWKTGEIKYTENTKAIHHFNGSWLSPIEAYLRDKELSYIKKFGTEIGEIKYNKWYSHRKLFLNIRRYGIKAVAQNLIKKLKSGNRKDT